MNSNILIDLILIQIIVVIIIDISGVVSHIESAIARALSLKKVRIHLIECSFCVNHHISVIYLLFNGALSLKSYALVLVLCFLTSITKDLLWGVRDRLVKLVSKL